MSRLSIACVTRNQLTWVVSVAHWLGHWNNFFLIFSFQNYEAREGIFKKPIVIIIIIIIIIIIMIVNVNNQVCLGRVHVGRDS